MQCVLNGAAFLQIINIVNNHYFSNLVASYSTSQYHILDKLLINGKE